MPRARGRRGTRARTRTEAQLNGDRLVQFLEEARRLELERPNAQTRFTGITVPRAPTYAEVTRGDDVWGWVPTPNILLEPPETPETPRPQPPNRNQIMMASDMDCGGLGLRLESLQEAHNSLTRLWPGGPDQLWVNPARHQRLIEVLFPLGPPRNLDRPMFNNADILQHQSIRLNELVLVNSRRQLMSQTPDELNMRIWNLEPLITYHNYEFNGPMAYPYSLSQSIF